MLLVAKRHRSLALADCCGVSGCRTGRRTQPQRVSMWGARDPVVASEPLPGIRWQGKTKCQMLGPRQQRYTACTELTKRMLR